MTVHVLQREGRTHLWVGAPIFVSDRFEAPLYVFKKMVGRTIVTFHEEGRNFLEGFVYAGQIGLAKRVRDAVAFVVDGGETFHHRFIWPVNV